MHTNIGEHCEIFVFGTNNASLVLKNPADIYIYTCNCLCVPEYTHICAYTLFSSRYLVPGKVALLWSLG